MEIPTKKVKVFDTNLKPTISNWVNGRMNLKFNFISNLYIVYELNFWPHNPTNNFTLQVFFSTVKLTRNADKSKFTWNNRAIAFDRDGFWSFDNRTIRNAAIFSVNNSSASHTDNRKNNFLVLDEGSTYGINDNTGESEKS